MCGGGGIRRGTGASYRAPVGKRASGQDFVLSEAFLEVS